MTKNNKLNDLLDKGPIKRGKGFSLSTEEQPQESAPAHKSTKAQVHKSTTAQMQESTNADVHKSINTLEHKDTSAQVHKSTTAQKQEGTDAEVHKSTSALEHKSLNALVQKEAEDIRPSKGYKLRTDVADACKVFAVSHKRKLYEVMEEALIEYLQKHGVNIH